MHGGRAKLPDAQTLGRHLDDGMGHDQVAARYGCHPETVLQALDKAGLLERKKRTYPVDGPRPVGKPREKSPIGVEIMPDRIVLRRKTYDVVTGGNGIERIFLAFNSMHAATLEE